MKIMVQTQFSCQRDGLTIRGCEYRPQGENLPVAIVSHGFMANQMTVRHYAQFLAGMGYAAFCFDFNGGSVLLGKSDGKTTDMSVMTEVSDLCAVIEYARGLEYTNSSDILLMGCSQGGLVSALTAAKLKDQVSRLVLFYPAFCIPDDARKGKMMWARFEPQHIPETVKCGPMKLGRCYIADVINMDPYAAIRGYEGDVLIVHGTADKIVSISYAQRAAEAYKGELYDRGVTYHAIEGGKHMFSGRHDKMALTYLKEFADIQQG